MARNDEIRLDQEVSASPARVWEVLTRPALWWNEGVTLDARIGGHFFEPWNDGVVERRTFGTITEIEPPRLLAMSWEDEDWDFETMVTITIIGERASSLISLRHRGWNDAPPAEREQLAADHRSGWLRHLKSLASCAESIPKKR